MGDKIQVDLDRAQVKKAVLALQAFLKTQSAASKKLFTDESQKISILFTLWKIPKCAQTIRIPLPHGQRVDSEEVCLFTRDEPQMTGEQTQRFYKKLLQERGVQNVTEVIPYKILKTEYKQFEAKRRLLGNFDMFLSDERIRFRLATHIGKHFYERKREPLSVNLLSKNLARDVQKLVQGTSLKVNNKGSCCMARIGHTGMTADELTENIEVAVQTVMEKVRMKGPVMKIIHLKSETSVALPIYASGLDHLRKPEEAEAESRSENAKQTSVEDREKKAKKRKVEEDDDEEIPQLVPMETPKPKAKLKKRQPAERKHANILLKLCKTKAAKGKGKKPKVK